MSEAVKRRENPKQGTPGTRPSYAGATGSVQRHLERRRLTRSCASERTNEELTEATSSEEILSRRRAAAALARFFGLGFVDVFSSDSHIGDDIHTVTADFHKSLSDCQKLITAVFAHHQLSRPHLGHHSDVLRKKAHLAVHSRKRRSMPALQACRYAKKDCIRTRCGTPPGYSPYFTATRTCNSPKCFLLPRHVTSCM